MADIMNFPKRWEDFLHDYEFEDSRRVYTNGSRLIQSFRVEQMMEHYAPVRHGQWGEEPVEFWSIPDYKCSVCGCYAIEDSKGKQFLSKYCPNCGAKMDGVSDG